MTSYKVGQLSTLMSSGSSVSGKRKKKAEKLKLLFSTPLSNHKGNINKLVIENTNEDILKGIRFDAGISPIEEAKKKVKKKHKKMASEDQTQEIILKTKKKHARKVDLLSARDGTKVDENHLQKETSASEKNIDSKQKMIKKRKRKASESNKEIIKIDNTRNEDENHMQKIISASGNNIDSNEKMTKKRKREDSESNKEIIKIDDTRNPRTVFVGNLPTSFNKEDLKCLFKQFGKVENARIRSAAPPKASLPKKVAVIKQLYHPDVHSFNGFVVFDTEEMAHAALELNGAEIKGHHIRVDIANRNQEHDHKRSIFVGNLPFDIQDDDLWDFFQECGGVRQVRIIRDKETRIGKGFGYILFRTVDAAALALEKNGEKLNGRPLRISRSIKKERKFPRGKLSNEARKKLHGNKRYQGNQAKERLRLKKNKKMVKNRLRLKKKKMLAQKLQSGLTKASDR